MEINMSKCVASLTFFACLSMQECNQRKS